MLFIMLCQRWLMTAIHRALYRYLVLRLSIYAALYLTNLEDYSVMASSSPYHHLYNTKQWRRLRHYHLQDNPLCVFCLAKGNTTAANIADHIKPHRGDVSLFYEASNIQSLCKRCHDSTKQRMEKGGQVTEFTQDGRVIW